jgi:hypothetical protein
MNIPLSRVRELPEYRELIALGFVDATGPIQEKKSSALVLEHPNFNPRFVNGPKDDDHPYGTNVKRMGCLILYANGFMRYHMDWGALGSPKPNPVPGWKKDERGENKTLDDWKEMLVYARQYFFNWILNNDLGVSSPKQRREMSMHDTLADTFAYILDHFPATFTALFNSLPEVARDTIIDIEDGRVLQEVVDRINKEPEKYAVALKKQANEDWIKKVVPKLNPAIRDKFVDDLNLTGDLHDLLNM